MPNHVTNIIEIKGNPSRIKAMFEAIKSDEHGLGSIDFNKLIPMPPELNIEEGSRTKHGLKAYKDFLEVYNFNREPNIDLGSIPEKAEQAFLRVRPDVDSTAWSLGKQAYQNKQKYGAHSWYDWRTKNWGTKWDAYGYESGVHVDGHSLRFQTAWAPPQPVIAKLSEMYPDLDFTHQYASEDIGVNCGEDEYHNGSLCGEYRPAGLEARNFANMLWERDCMEEDEEEIENMGGMKL